MNPKVLTKDEVMAVMPSLRERLLARGGTVAEYVRHLLEGTAGSPGLADCAAADAGELSLDLAFFTRMVARARETDFTSLEQRELGLRVP